MQKLTEKQNKQNFAVFSKLNILS